MDFDKRSKRKTKCSLYRPSPAGAQSPPRSCVGTSVAACRRSHPATSPRRPACLRW